MTDVSKGMGALAALAALTAIDLPAVPGGEPLAPPANVRSVDSDTKLDAASAKKSIERLDKIDARMNDETLKPLMPAWQKQREASMALAEAASRIAAAGETSPQVVMAYRLALRQNDQGLIGWDLGTAAILKERNLPPAPPKEKEELKPSKERTYARADVEKQVEALSIYLESMQTYATRNKDALGDSFRAWEKTADGVSELLKSARDGLKFGGGRQDAQLLEAHGLALASAFAQIGGAGEVFRLTLAGQPREKKASEAALPGRIVVIDDVRFNQQKLELVFGATMARQGLAMLGDKAPPGLDKAIDTIRDGALKARTPAELTGVLLEQMELFSGFGRGGKGNPLGSFAELVQGGARNGSRQAGLSAASGEWLEYYDKNIGFRLNINGRTGAVDRLLKDPLSFETIRKGAGAAAEDIGKRWKDKEMPAGTKQLVEQLGMISGAKTREDIKLTAPQIRAALDQSAAALKARK